MEEPLKRKELRHDRHTVSLLTDHLVITPKYRGKILTGEVGFIALMNPIISLYFLTGSSNRGSYQGNMRGNEHQDY
jgi:hypothetical protein